MEFVKRRKKNGRGTGGNPLKGVVPQTPFLNFLGYFFGNQDKRTGGNPLKGVVPQTPFLNFLGYFLLGMASTKKGRGGNPRPLGA